MRVYKLDIQSHYQAVDPEFHLDDNYSFNRGPRGEMWKDMPAKFRESPDAVFQPADIIRFGSTSTVLLNERAMEVAGERLAPFGEFLPQSVEGSDETWMVFNCTNVSDALIEEEADLDFLEFDDGTSVVMGINMYAFDESRIDSFEVFRIRQRKSEGPFFTGEVVDWLLEESGLTVGIGFGLVFDEVAIDKPERTSRNRLPVVLREPSEDERSEAEAFAQVAIAEVADFVETVLGPPSYTYGYIVEPEVLPVLINYWPPTRRRDYAVLVTQGAAGAVASEPLDDIQCAELMMLIEPKAWGGSYAAAPPAAGEPGEWLLASLRRLARMPATRDAMLRSGEVFDDPAFVENGVRYDSWVLIGPVIDDLCDGFLIDEQRDELAAVLQVAPLYDSEFDAYNNAAPEHLDTIQELFLDACSAPITPDRPPLDLTTVSGGS